jgi:hypothetical protein
MSIAIRLLAEPVRSVAFGVISPVYSTLGSPVKNPIRLIVLQNFCNTAVMLSLDGVKDHLPMVPNGYLILDISSNKTMPAGGFYLAEGSQLYIKQLGAAPGSGAVYVSVFYGKDI